MISWRSCQCAGFIALSRRPRCTPKISGGMDGTVSSTVVVGLSPTNRTLSRSTITERLKM